MKVCFICSGFGEVHCGAQKQLTKLIHKLSTRGCEITLLSRKSLTTKNIPNAQLALIPDYFSSVRMLGSLSFIIFAFIWVLRNRKNIDIIHAIQMYSNTTIGVLAKIFFKIPVVTKITATNEFGEVKTIRKLPFFSIRKRLLAGVDRFIAITTQAQNELISLGIDNSKIIFIPNGVNLSQKLSFKQEDKQVCRNELNLNNNKIAVYLGRFSDEKNIDIALESICRLKQNPVLEGFKFLLVGGAGNYRSVEAKLKNIIQKNELDKYVGFIPSVENVYDYLVASDIFVLLSTSEGLSNALLEAMACGCCVLATDIDANKDLLKDNQNSILVKVRDIEGTTEAFKKILGEEVDTRQFGLNARKVVEENYSMPVVAERHLELYRDVIKNKIV